MHELLLFAQVLSSWHDQLLQILAGVTGMQPQRVVERHLIFKPSRSPGQTSAQVGGSQGVQNAQLQALQGQLHNELYYLQLVGEVNDSRFGGRTSLNTNAGKQENFDLREGESEEEGENDARLKGHQHQQPRQTWTLHFKDLPEVAGRRAVTSRMMLSVDILKGDAFAFMDELGYTYVSEYVIEGQRFIHQNIILLLHRVLRSSLGGEAHGSPSQALPEMNRLVLLDPSSAYVLQASIRIHDGSKPESISVGINELKAFKEMMRGVVDLDIGDRLALDTRLK